MKTLYSQGRACVPLLLACFGVSLSTVLAQVTVDPPFPQESDEITVFYDASQGTAGLAGCGCDVYLHTGVITAASTSPSDWQNVPTQWGVANPAWQLSPVPGRPDVYSITYTIADFYNLAAGTEVEKLAFVFRDATGSREGKGPGGTDIFYDLLPPGAAYELRLLDPTGNPVVREGDDIRVYAATTQPSSAIEIYVDGSLEASVSGSAIDLELPALVGEHRVELVGTAEQGGTESRASFRYYATGELPAVAPRPGVEPGYTDLGNGRSVWYFYAPGKDRALLRGWWGGGTVAQMSPLTDGLGFVIELDTPPADSLVYQYSVEGGVTVADPFGDLILDPAEDRFIAESTFAGIPDVRDMAGIDGVATWVRPAPPFDWQHDDYDRPAEGDLVIYELLVRDFVAAHDYATVLDSLDYFERLGVNAIELMPVNEFEGNLSWGYNPSYHNALDKYYGPPEDLKALVDAAHGRGIAVFVDVVFNHGFGQNPYVRMYGAERASAPGGAGPFYNATARHPFNVGVDANHESIHQQRYTGRILRHWIEEYHFDGYRFDLSKGFTQTDNPNDVGAWSDYDASRIAILKGYQDTIRAVDPASHVMLEHLGTRREEIELAEAGMLLWGNMNFNYGQLAMGYNDNGVFGVTPESRGFAEPRLIGYMESHDEERLTYKVRAFGNGAAGYETQEYSESLRRMELASHFFYTTPGPKMLWQFGEYGYDIPIDQNGRTGNKPIRWDWLERPANRRLFDVTRGLIGLRRDYPVFRDGPHVLRGLNEGLRKTVTMESADLDVVVVGNADVVDRDVTGRFPAGGTYYDYWTGTSLAVAAAGDLSVALAPGEYRLYTSRQLPEPPGGFLGAVSAIEDAPGVGGLSVFPNPAPAGGFLRVTLEDRARTIASARLVDLNGRTIMRHRPRAGLHAVELALTGMNPAAYVLEITTDGGAVVRRRLVVSR